ncbi:helicase HerA-like domain-containing protein [Streptomyces sp. P1-3]|uniref:helicase HerA-like domain-containing protein n=1 Tax=Streptomyces sp. P1-3 TaxID=3421658 RepID=UPI003D36304B
MNERPSARRDSAQSAAEGAATEGAATGAGAAHVPDVPDVPDVPGGIAAELAAAYAFPGPALDLGALLWGGACLRDAPVRVPLSVLNRHGLVAGAGGTGATRTLQLMAERISAHGVPVFLTDVDGDLSGVSVPGTGGEEVERRMAEVGEEWTALGYPAEFYALGGLGTGIPLRATATAIGPVLLSRALGLERDRERSLERVFQYADGKGLELTGLSDLRALVASLASEGAEGVPTGLTDVGGPSAAAAGAVLGVPEFDANELLRIAPDGRGVVSVLELAAVRDASRLCSASLMWLLADLCHELPDVGDVGVDKPRLVFFFDGARPLFDGASEAFRASVTRTMRLLGSKGVGVFFVTRGPHEVPAEVLGRLGTRVQHAPRTGTSDDDAEARGAAVRALPRAAYDLEELLTGLGTGEAVVTVPSGQGAPTPAAAVRLRAPQSLMGSLGAAELEHAVAGSELFGRYAQAVDRGPGSRTGPAGRPGSRPGQEIARSLLGTAPRGR